MSVEKEPIYVEVKAVTQKTFGDLGPSYKIAGNPVSEDSPYIRIYIETKNGDNTKYVSSMLSDLGIIANAGTKDEGKPHYRMNHNSGWLDVIVFDPETAGRVISALSKKYPNLVKNEGEIKSAHEELSATIDRIEEDRKVSVTAKIEDKKILGKSRHSHGYGVEDLATGGSYREKKPYIAIEVKVNDKRNADNVKAILENLEIDQRSNNILNSLHEPKENYAMDYPGRTFFIDVFSKERAHSVINALRFRYDHIDDVKIRERFAEFTGEANAKGEGFGCGLAC